MSSFKDVPLAVKITIPNVFTHMPCESYVEMGRGGGLKTGSFSQVLFLSLKSRASLGVIGCGGGGLFVVWVPLKKQADV